MSASAKTKAQDTMRQASDLLMHAGKHSHTFDDGTSDTLAYLYDSFQDDYLDLFKGRKRAGSTEAMAQAYGKAMKALTDLRRQMKNM